MYTLSSSEVHSVLTLPKRIGGFVRRLSPNYRRNKSLKSKTATDAPAPPTVSQPNSTPFPPATNGYQLFKSSDHPLRPRTAGARDGRGDVGGFAKICSQVYKSLPDREDFESEAKQRNEARRVAKASAQGELSPHAPAPAQLASQAPVQDVRQTYVLLEQS